MKTLFTLLFSLGVLLASAQQKLNVSGAITIAEFGADSYVTITKGLEAVIAGKNRRRYHEGGNRWKRQIRI